MRISTVFSLLLVAVSSHSGFASVLATNFTALHTDSVLAVLDGGNNFRIPDGRPCSENLTNAWLDLIIIIEQSATTERIWSAITEFVLSQIVGRLTLSNTDSKSHTSRIAIIGYGTNATLLYSFTDTQAIKNVMFALNTAKPVNANDDVNIKEASDLVDYLQQTQSSFRVPTGIMIAATFPWHIQVRDVLNVRQKLVTVSFAENATVSELIGKFTTPGLNLTSTSNNTQATFAQMNCVCDGRMEQLTVDTLSYAECFYYGYYYDVSNNPPLFKCASDSDILAVANTHARANFLNNVTTIFQFGIGLSRSNGSASWKWSNGANYEGYPVFSTTPTSSDTYGYIEQGLQGTWKLKSDDGTIDTHGYFCQRRACDADFFCDLSK